MLIEVNNVTKKYFVKSNLFSDKFNSERQREIIALHDISFSVDSGEVLGIIGSNGSGKSSLLKILSGITPPTSGDIFLKGKILSLLEVGTGFHPELTGRENIFLNGAIMGMPKSDIVKKIESIINFSGVNDFIDVPVKKYSSGMYIRLAFSVVAHMDPDILLIDEVLAVGDLDFQKKCINKINIMAKENNRAVIIVSHNLDVIQSLCKKCLWINKGNIVEYGKTNNIINNYLNDDDNFLDIPINNRKDRLGNGKIKIYKVELREETGKIVNFFSSGQNVVFYLYYRVYNNNINSVEVALPINSAILQKRIANIYSKTIGKKIIINKKEGCIKIKIEKLPLNIGKYFYNIWLGNDGEIYDNIINAGYFNVLFGDYYKSGELPPAEHGVMLLDYKIIK